MTVILDKEIKDPVIGYVLGTKESIVSLIYKKLKKAEKHRDKLADGEHRCYEIYALIKVEVYEKDVMQQICEENKEEQYLFGITG